MSLAARASITRGTLRAVEAGCPSPSISSYVRVMFGDFNDRPFADVMEAEFLIGNLLDELVGSFLEPNTYFKHAMVPERLSSAATTRFRDPLSRPASGAVRGCSAPAAPAAWSRRRRGKRMSTPAAPDDRQNRPSDHKPVSVVIDWDD